MACRCARPGPASAVTDRRGGSGRRWLASSSRSQRWPYWLAAGFALTAALWDGVAGRLALLLAGASVLVSGGIAALHLGVEWGWWPSPLPGCLAPPLAAGLSVEDMLRALPAAPTVPCDAAVYPLAPLPLSFAALNLIYASALGAVTLSAAFRRPR